MAYDYNGAKPQDTSRLDEAWKEMQQYMDSAMGELKETFKSFNDIIQNSYMSLNQLASDVKDYKNPDGDFQKRIYGTGSNKKKGSGFVEGKDEKGGFAGDLSAEMSDDFTKALSDMALGYEDFSTAMKKMGADLMDYLVKSAIDGIAKMMFSQQNVSSLFDGVFSLFGGGGKAAKGIGGFIGNLFKHHDGGIIPSGANYALPGTDEQLAMLKGGERVLSPSENTSYEGAQGGGSPVVLNNFNIKAWDSKDVSKYLMENKQLLNQITFEGIKNNNSMLRTMVRNA